MPPSHPGPVPDEVKVSGSHSPLPGAQPSRRRNRNRAAATRLPAQHWAGLLPYSVEPATCWANKAAPDGVQLPPPDRQPARGNAASIRETQRQLRRRRHGATPRSALRGVFPLSAAQQRPDTPYNVQRQGKTRGSSRAPTGNGVTVALHSA